MNWYQVLSLFLTFFIWSVIAKPNDDLSVLSRQTREVACSKELFTGLKSCCERPMLIPQATIENCISKAIKFYEISSSSTTSTTTKKPKYGKFGAFGALMKKNFDDASNTFAATMKKIMEEKPLCIHECAFRAEGLLTSSGNVVETAVKNKFLNNANPDWKDTIADAIGNCTTEMTKQKLSYMLPYSEKLCNFAPVQFFFCIQRFTMLKCPALDNENSECNYALGQAMECNPMIIPKEYLSMAG